MFTPHLPPPRGTALGAAAARGRVIGGGARAPARLLVRARAPALRARARVSAIAGKHLVIPAAAGGARRAGAPPLAGGRRLPLQRWSAPPQHPSEPTTHTLSCASAPHLDTTHASSGLPRQGAGSASHPHPQAPGRPARRLPAQPPIPSTLLPQPHPLARPHTPLHAPLPPRAPATAPALSDRPPRRMQGRRLSTAHTAHWDRARGLSRPAVPPLIRSARHCPLSVPPRPFAAAHPLKTPLCSHRCAGATPRLRCVISGNRRA